MENLNIDMVKTVETLLKIGKKEEIKNLLKTLHPVDIAEMLIGMKRSSQKTIFSMLDIDKAADVLEELEVDMQLELIDGLKRQKLRKVLDEFSIDDLIDLIQEIPKEKSRKIMKQLDQDSIKEIKELIIYAGDTAGGLMTTEYVYISQDLTVSEAIKTVRKFGNDAETIYYIYVVDKNHKLVGVLSLRELISAPREKKISNIMHKNIVTVNVLDDQEEVAKTINKYSLLAVPVVNENMKLLGIVTVDDALEVIEEESTEDIHRFAGILTQEDVLLKSSPFGAARRRLPWLFVCLVGDFLAGTVIKGFSATLEQVIAVAFFIPVLMATGGNVGTQSLVLAVRGLATGELNSKNIYKDILHETGAGLMVGMICGIIIALISYVWQKSFMLGFVVGSSMTVALTIAALIGMVIPLIFNYFKIDPAIASGPFITTLIDVTTLLVYFIMVTATINYII